MPANNYVTSGQTISFLTGPQSAVDTILANGYGAIHGAFYLTQDSHRLYVGNEDTSLSCVNEGITTFADMTTLEQQMPAPSDLAAWAGRFFWIESPGILCVFNGKKFLKINENTNTRINSVTTTVENVSTGVDVIQTRIVDEENRSFDGRFRVVSGSGTSVSYATETISINNTNFQVPKITVNAGYTLSVKEDNSNNTTSIQLASNEDSNVRSNVVVKAGKYRSADLTSNVRIYKDTDDSLAIGAKDTKVTGINATNNSTAGFDITITDNENTAGLTTNVQPKVKYGVNSNYQQTVDFVSGVATLDTYSRSEVDNFLKELNAMHYIGTFADAQHTPSGADTIDYNTTPGEVHVFLSGTEIPMHIGDVFLVAENEYNLGPRNETKKIYKGSLLIARGTENTNGVITPDTLEFDVVESTYDMDTRYQLVQETSGVGGVSLKTTDNTTTTGTLLFTGGTNASDSSGTTTNDLIKVTKTYANLAGNQGGQQATITIKHKDVTRTDPAATTVSQTVASALNGWGGGATNASTSITYVTGVTTNESGHVTGVSTQTATLKDTSTHFPSSGGNQYATSAFLNSPDSMNVGVIGNTITLEAGGAAGSTTTATHNVVLTSKSLTISDDDSHGTSSGASQHTPGLNIEMTWGSFS